MVAVSGRRDARGRWLACWVAAALVAYVPLLCSRPGMVAADTKQYLYLDPGRLTAGAASMWDPTVGMGTVTHQNIGYLWPMGPYYTVVAWLGVPTWVGQRLWMGSLLLAAGAGAWWAARRLGVAPLGAVVAGVVYGLSPYQVDYLTRTSAIAMPWAALGWLLGLVVIAARSGRWRPVCGVAVLVALVGGVNATSICLVGLAPVAWLVWAVAAGELAPRAALRTAWRVGVASALVSLWWVAGLWAEARYGIDVLRVTETVPTVAHTSSAAEVLRGLGYWYFYGWDKVQPWTQAAVPYTQDPWLLAVTFAVPAVAVALGWLGRWRQRSFATLLLVVGVAVAVGAYPYAHPSLVGRLLESASSGSTAALAARSVDRAVPLVVLGLALLAGAGAAEARLRRPGPGAVAATACVGLAAAGLPALWTGSLVATNLERAAALPRYWRAAAAHLDAVRTSSRVLGLPGEDFAAYSWGVTQDPVGPGVLRRPWVSRQVVPQGTPPSADLLQALDEPIQEGTSDPAALAPIARLMGVGDILLQSDLQSERYGLPHPEVLWQALQPTPAGLAGPTSFGGPHLAAPIRYPRIDEASLAVPAGAAPPPALADYAVPGARPLVRSEPAAAPLVVAGDGTGLVDAASAGLLGGSGAVLYSATLDGDRSAARRALAAGATLVLTDSDLRAEHRWGSLHGGVGAVETTDPPLVVDPSTYELPVFPGAGSETQTVATYSGIRDVRVSDEGAVDAADGGIDALDGALRTAWTFGAATAVGGQRIRIDLAARRSLDRLTVVQAVRRPPGVGAGPPRQITAVTVEVDGRPVTRRALGPASRTAAGQVLRWPAVVGDRVDLVVDGATGDGGHRHDGLADVGISELRIPGVRPVTEALRLPTDLLGWAGPASATHRLVVLMDRLRSPQPSVADTEPAIRRTFELPTARTFAFSGAAELSTQDPDPLIDTETGRTGAGAPGGPPTVLGASSSGRLIGDRRATAMAAVDGDPGTAWVPETGRPGSWLRYRLSAPLTLDHLDLRVLDDGRHSLPSRLTVTAGGASRTVVLPALAPGTGRPQGSTTEVRVAFAPITGADVAIRVDAVRPVTQQDYYVTFAPARQVLPVGIAELGLAVRAPTAPAAVPARCRDDLVAVDGRPVPVEVTGPTAAATAGRALALRACGPAAAGVRLGPGSHTVTTAAPGPAGWSVDRLELDAAAPGGTAPRPGAARSGGAGPGDPAVAARILHQDRTSATVVVPASPDARWLVLGESYSDGWTATTSAGRDLGAPVLIDGYADGWYLPAGSLRSPMVVTLRWTPQRVVWAALAVSGTALAACTAIALVPDRWARRRRRRPGAPGCEPDRGRAPAPRRGTVVVATLAAAAALAAVATPLTGAVLLAGAAAGVAGRRGRRVLRGAAVAALVAAGTYVLIEQVRWRYWPDINWPLEVPLAHDLAWAAVALLVADVATGVWRRSWAAGGPR